MVFSWALSVFTKKLVTSPIRICKRWDCLIVCNVFVNYKNWCQMAADSHSSFAAHPPWTGWKENRDKNRDRCSFIMTCRGNLNTDNRILIFVMSGWYEQLMRKEAPQTLNYWLSSQKVSRTEWHWCDIWMYSHKQFYWGRRIRCFSSHLKCLTAAQSNLPPVLDTGLW